MENLIGNGYEVHGIVRRVAIEEPDHGMSCIYILDRLVLHPSMIENYTSMSSAIADTRPAKLYHLAAQSLVAKSFEDAFSTLRIF